MNSGAPRLLAPLLLGLLLVGCAERDETCTIAPSGEEGVRILTCPSGSLRVYGGSTTGTCAKHEEESGWARVACDDGTSFLLDPNGNVHFPGKGAITGEAKLWGVDEEAHAGITVRILHTPFSTETDASGAFQLANLPAGTYQLLFEYPGRAPQLQENVPVINGAYVTSPVELRIGTKVAGEQQPTLFTTDAEEELLVWEGDGTLTLFEIETGGSRLLSRNAASPSLRFDGRRVLWVENLSSRSQIKIFDVDAGVTRDLPVRGIEAAFLGDGRAVIVRTVAEGQDGLLVFDLASQTTTELGKWTPRALADLPMSGPYFAYHGETGSRLYDHLNGRSTLLSEGTVDLSRVYFDPDGRAVIFSRPRPGQTELIRLEFGTDEITVLEAALAHGQNVIQGPGPDGTLLWQGGAGWRLWDPALEEVVDLQTSEGLAVLAADGSAVSLWSNDGAGGGVARLYLREAEEWWILADAATHAPQFSSDARFAIVARRDGEGRVSSRLFSIEDRTSIDFAGFGWEFSGDGRWLAGISMDGLSVASTETGKVVMHFPAVASFKLFHRGHVAYHSMTSGGATGELMLWDPTTGKHRSLGSGGESVMGNGRYVFFRSCEDTVSCNLLYRFDLARDRLELVDDRIRSSWFGGSHKRFLLYQVPQENQDPGELHLVMYD